MRHETVMKLGPETPVKTEDAPDETLSARVEIVATLRADAVCDRTVSATQVIDDGSAQEHRP